MRERESYRAITDGVYGTDSSNVSLVFFYAVMSSSRNELPRVRNLPLLETLASLNSKQLSSVIAHGDKELIDTLCEVVSTIINRKTDLKPEDNQLILRERKILQRITAKRTSYAAKKNCLASAAFTKRLVRVVLRWCYIQREALFETEEETVPQDQELVPQYFKETVPQDQELVPQYFEEQEVVQHMEPVDPSAWL